MVQCRSCRASGERDTFNSLIEYGLRDTYQKLIQKKLPQDSEYTLVCLRCLKFLQKLSEFRLTCIEANEYFEELEQNDVHEMPVDFQLISDVKIKVEPLPVIDTYTEVATTRKEPKETVTEPIPSDIYACPICSKTFTNKYYFNSHKKIHEEGKYECHFCGRKFPRKQYLLSHLLARHIEKDFGRTGDFICDICQNRYLNAPRLERHLKIHTKNLAPCPVCAKMVKNMTCHMRSHETVAERFQCDSCGKNYKAKKDLVSHKIIHENKTFSCEVCGKGFNQPSKVQQHMRIHKPDRPTFPCHHCNHNFLFKSSLLEHLRCNSGERRFVCSVCTFAFKKASALKKHMHTHNGTKPYMCSQCSYGTKKKKEFLEHLKRIHGDIGSANGDK